MTNLHDGWLVRDLSEGEARAIFAILSVQERLATRVWTEAWGQVWKAIDSPECSFLFVARAQTQSPPTVPIESNEPVEITQVHIPKMTGRQSNAAPAVRRHTRFEVQIPVTIQTSAEQFDTTTTDVSEGGIRLKDPLPDKFAGYCQVVFNPRTTLRFVVLANLVEDQKNARMHLEFVDGEEQWKFIEWLRAQAWAKSS